MEPSCEFTTCEVKGSRYMMNSLGCTRHLQWKLVLKKAGMWNISSMAGKEPELMCEMENYGLDIDDLTSTHRMGSSTKLLDQRWSLPGRSSHRSKSSGGYGNIHQSQAEDFSQGTRSCHRKENSVVCACTKQQFRAFSRWPILWLYHQTWDHLFWTIR